MKIKCEATFIPKSHDAGGGSSVNPKELIAWLNELPPHAEIPTYRQGLGSWGFVAYWEEER